MSTSTACHISCFCVRGRAHTHVCATQETGRGGRDGKTAVCILYYSYGDAVRMRHMLKQSAEEQGTSPAQLQCNMDSLNQMARSRISSCR